MWPLCVLIWRHFLVRKRRFIHTPVEFLFPIIGFVILFAIRGSLFPERRSDKYNNVQNTEPFPIDSAPAPRLVFYTPPTEPSSTLMDEVGRKLGLPRLNQVPEEGGHGYVGVANESLIGTRYGNNDVILHFHNLNTTWPKKLNYTIRTKDSDHNVHSYKSHFMEPHESFGTMYETFMRVQWAVDTSYLRMLTGAEIPQTLTLQEFPYSHPAQNLGVILLQMLLSLFCPLALLLTFVFLMTRLMAEKNSGIQELMKMSGVGTETICVAHFVNVLPGGLMYALIGGVLLTASSNALLPHSSGLVIFLVLFLHFTSIVPFAFFFAYLINTTQHLTTISAFVYLFSTLPSKWLTELRNPVLRSLAGLTPHTPLAWCWQQVAAREMYGRGMTFESIAEATSKYSGSVLFAIVCMLIQTCVFALLAWYLTLVRPGNYGQGRPWNFICLKSYCCKATKVKTVPTEETQLHVPDPQYFEPVPGNRVAGIQILGVTKAFPKHTALSNLTFDVLQGEITVFLGHNGAGKTTLMSIITGILAPTSGKILVNGLDISSQKKAVRSQLGLCPQHNLFFPDLTVIQHVMFFSLLKGGTLKQARLSSVELLAKLNLLDKANNMTSALSGGMKRRVQLACALSGNARVLLLDEPTSGLDVQARRQLWNILLNLRGDHTVLLTTHFMEEADALGDRVAALRAGHLQCHATTMFLKRAIGTGYRLSLTTVGAPNENAITDAVCASVPEASVCDKAMNSISYSLPAKESARFPELFASLEENRSKLGINTIGVGKSSLDEVFLKLCSDVQTSFEPEDDTVEPERTSKKLTGIRLCCRRFWLLLKRHYYYTMSKKFSFIILQVIVPIVFICVVTALTNNDAQPPPEDGKPTAMNLDLYDDMGQRHAFFNTDYDSVMPVLRTAYKGVGFKKAGDVAGAALDTAKHDVLEYNKYLVGFELNDTHAKALYTTVVRHAAPVAVNLVSNALAARLMAGADGRTITVQNLPPGLGPPGFPGLPPGFMPPKIVIQQPKGVYQMTLWAVAVTVSIMFTLASNTTLPCRERTSGTRHIHFMAGCPEWLHWASKLVAHMLCALLFLVAPTLIAAAYIEKDHTINTPGFIGALTITLLLGIMALLAAAYVLSVRCTERVTSTLGIIFIIVFGIVTPLIHIGATAIAVTSWVYYITEVMSYVFPPHSLTLAMAKCGSAAFKNALCALNRQHCAALAMIRPGFPNPGIQIPPGIDAKCCASSSDIVPYSSLEKKAPGRYWLVLFGQFVVYGTLVLLIEKGVFRKLRERTWSKRLPPPKPRFDDAMVRAEKAYVKKAIQLPKKQISEALLCHDMHKYFPSMCKKSLYAVKGINFSVKKGECFGLLGVNGAGKSTTFKMLAAETRPTRGTLVANQYHFDNAQYMRSISYCPQFFGLDDFLSGRQNLELVLTLQGLNAADAKATADSWIKEVGLEAYASRRVATYSGGCARRLAAAAALCQQVAVVLLDEPTAGVDAAARRRLHRAVRRARRHRALVVASHSMDEMEVLCDRIAIMSGGEMCALGSAGALRAQHASGHMLVIKLRSMDGTDGSVADSVANLQDALHDSFDCELQDEHDTMLHYNLKDSMGYSELFARIEALRASHPVIEDYSVSETTLEEVFLSFARDDKPTATV